MFWKKKEIQKEKQGDEPEKDAVFSSCNTTILKRKTRHAKTIIENKLYDTEKAEIIFLAKQQIMIIWRTKKIKHIIFLKLHTMTYDWNH